MPEVDFRDLFPVGSRVLCESEMWPGKSEYGTVLSHLETRYGVSCAIHIRMDDSPDGCPGALVDYDYRYLDADPHRSLVRLVSSPA